MNIAFDIRPFLKEESGVGVYLKGLLSALSKIDEKNRYLLFSSSLKDRLNKKQVPEFKNVKVRDYRIPVSILNYLWYKTNFPPLSLLFLNKIDIVHSPVPKNLPGGRRKIITVHDLCFIEKPLLVMKEAIKYFKESFLKELDKADGIIAVSEFTKSKVLEITQNQNLEKKIRVIYEGSDISEIKSKKPAFEIPGKYFLFVGTIEPRKNLSRLLRAISIIKEKIPEVKLIVVGKKGWAYKEIFGQIPKLNIGENVIITDYISRQELKFLYENTQALVFPSLYEGFGLPILEAIYLNKPVLASDLEVFREIFDDYPIYFDPLSYEDIAEKIINFLKTKEWRKENLSKILAQKLNWENTGKKTLEFYESIL